MARRKETAPTMSGRRHHELNANQGIQQQKPIQDTHILRVRRVFRNGIETLALCVQVYAKHNALGSSCQET